MTNIKLLIDSGLYGTGLIVVNKPELVQRYNDCLVALGQAPTTLPVFHIDEVGWSPEVAEEKGSVDYLVLNTVNRFAIILTPDQDGLPVYRPAHSFDRFIIERIFKSAKSQIAFLTERTGIWFQFTHELSRFRNPYDLLTIEWVNISGADTAGIIEAAVHQRTLTERFLEGDAWADIDLRQKIIESGKQHGDLRFKSVQIPEMKFTAVRMFHTRACGGAYVFRDITKTDNVIILEDGTKTPPPVADVDVRVIDDPELVDYLEEQDIIDVPLGFYKQHAGQEEVERMRYYFFAEAFFALGEEGDLHRLTPAAQASWISAHEDQIDPFFFEIEHLISDLKRGKTVDKITLSSRLKALLMTPSKAARKCSIAERVVWHLIARLVPQNIERLFVRNRLHFYDLYKTWPLAKQQWAVKHLIDLGHPKPITPSK